MEIRNEYFDQDLEDYIVKETDRLVEESKKHGNDKKWLTRNVFKMKTIFDNTKTDKLKFEQQSKNVANKTLKTLTDEERREYKELTEFIDKQLKEVLDDKLI